MSAGDLVSTKASKTNHILTGNPKSTVCGKFMAGGWLPANPGAETCKKCARVVERDIASHPIPENVGKPLGTPIYKAPHDELGSYHADKAKTAMYNRKRAWPGESRGA